MIDVQQILKAIEAHVRGWIQEMGGTPGSGGYAPTPHDLNSGHHTGSLGDGQAPQFLKTDGSRTLTGNLAAADGVTIDGEDVSALGSSVDGLVSQVGGLVSDFTAHDGATAGAAHTGGVGDHNHQSSGAQGGPLDHGAALTGLGDDDHPQYLLASGARAVAGNLAPDADETRDLGAVDKRWRKGWLSELEAILFSQNVVTIFGGKLMVGKGEGTVPAAVGAADTQIDFGQAMTPGDFLEFRAAGQYEYMQVGTLVSGTTYNVSRGLDASGADYWPAESVYFVLGASGQGRIEIDAINTPRISIKRQGATASAYTEVSRFGDMNGLFDFVAEEYGIGIGNYAGGNYLRYGPTTGFKLRAGDDKLSIDEGGIALTPLVFGESLGNLETALKWWYAAASKNILYMYPVVNTIAKSTSVNIIANQPSDADEDSDSEFYFSVNKRRAGLGQSDARMLLNFYGLSLANDAELDWGEAVYPKVFAGGVDVMLPEGWYPAYFEDKWVYVSATSFKIVGKDARSRYSTGTRLRCKQGGGWKYFYVVSAAFSTDTTVTITGGSDFSLANAAITDNWLSYARTPQGFPDWFNWTAVHTGYSAAPTGGVYRFRIDGRQVMATVREPNAGTSNGAGITISSPVTARTITGAMWLAPAGLVDNGISLTTWGRGRIGSGESVMTFGTNPAIDGGFTSGGGKRVSTFQLGFEI